MVSTNQLVRNLREKAQAQTQRYINEQRAIYAKLDLRPKVEADEEGWAGEDDQGRDIYVDGPNIRGMYLGNIRLGAELVDKVMADTVGGIDGWLQDNGIEAVEWSDGTVGLFSDVAGATDEAITKTEAVPLEAKDYEDYYKGTEEVKIDGEYQDVHVFEFPDDEAAEKFVNDVGGMPHPLGGPRAILSVEAKQEAISPEERKKIIDFSRELKKKLSSEYDQKFKIDTGKTVKADPFIGVRVHDYRTDVMPVDLRNLALDATYGTDFSRNKEEPVAGNVMKNSIAIRYSQWQMVLDELGLGDK